VRTRCSTKSLSHDIHSSTYIYSRPFILTKPYHPVHYTKYSAAVLPTTLPTQQQHDPTPHPTPYEKAYPRSYQPQQHTSSHEFITTNSQNQPRRPTSSTNTPHMEATNQRHSN
jgi:hypothetical protein